MAERPSAGSGERLVEWVKDPSDSKKKQPYFITLKEGGPMFFAALAEVHHDLGRPE